MPVPCHYCGEPIRLSGPNKDNHRTMNLKQNGYWVKLIWHTHCDPFTVSTIVTRKDTP